MSDITVTVTETPELFEENIEGLLRYVDSLYGLSENWISGQHSNRPDQWAINSAGDFLAGFRNEVLSIAAIPAPRILIAPLPTGGVGIQMNYSDLSIDITFYNNRSIAFEYSLRGVYFEIQCRDAIDSLQSAINLSRKEAITVLPQVTL